MNNIDYTSVIVNAMLEGWEYNQQKKSPLSMREFCEEWNVPRSTFQGWLRKDRIALANNINALRANEEGKSSKIKPSRSDVSSQTTEVLRMLANELSAISSDLNEIVDQL